MHLYLGTLLIAFSTLAQEIALSRLLSVVTWYHLAFFAVSTAMLGMTAGAARVYMRPDWFTSEKLEVSLARSSLWYALITPFSLISLCVLPLSFVPSVMSVFVLLLASVACSLPFYFSGIVVSAILTKGTLPIGKLYASDLLGASLGCLFVLGGLTLIDATSLILICGAIGVLAAYAFAWRSPEFMQRRLAGVSFVTLIVVAAINSSTVFGIRPLMAKGVIVSPTQLLLERWNSFSRITLQKPEVSIPQYWGPSPLAPKEPITQYAMNIDGGAGTTLRAFHKPADIDHLRFDVTNIVHYLRPHGSICVIGVGGGRDIQSALLFGHESILGVDINPIFIDILQHDLRDVANVANRPGVKFVVDEARSYLARNPETFSVVQMALIDTWAATGAGAFSLSENALYTVEGWQVFFSRLADDGIFTVSRWHDPNNLGETGRVLSLAMAMLFQAGVSDPASHIALVATDRTSSLLLSKRPFTPAEIAKLKATSAELQFTLAVAPGSQPENTTLRDVMAAGSPAELESAIADKMYNFEPSTDEKPYFFNMLKLSRLKDVPLKSSAGVLGGNLTATITLAALILCLCILTVVTIIVPLWVGPVRDGSAKRPTELLWSGAAYFSLIGAGFMCVEIALMQRLSTFLGHPVYALGVLLFTIIASTGIGSLFSDRLSTNGTAFFVLPTAAAAAIVAERFSLVEIVTREMSAQTGTKIALAVACIFPLGLLMGFFFPMGMKTLKSSAAPETPWYWALNGIFGVLCSALAVFISIYFGTSINFYVGALCYAALTPCLVLMRKPRETAEYPSPQPAASLQET